MLDIAPGTKVTVKITKRPTSAAAAKTLQRLLAKDPVVQKEDRRQTKVRKVGFRTQQRGGRDWEVRVVRQELVKAVPGEQGTITATADILRDLKSVERFVEVSKA